MRWKDEDRRIKRKIGRQKDAGKQRERTYSLVILAMSNKAYQKKNLSASPCKHNPPPSST